MKNIRKKLMSVLLAALLVVAATVSVLPVQAEGNADGLFTYEIVDGAVTITGCTESAKGALRIPSQIQGLSVAAIADKAFYGNNNITSVTVPASVTAISSGAFGKCMALTTIRVDEQNPVYCDVDGVLFSKDKTSLFCFPVRNADGSYTIPYGVTTIEPYAFFSCLLSTVEFPSTVTSIKTNAFHFSSSLKQITLPNSLISLEFGVFSSCVNLAEVNLPNSLTTIGKSAFAGCRSLEKIVVPGSVTSIGSSAFSGCTALKEVTIPESVTAISGRTFYFCTSLSTIALPSSITSIGDRAFFFCDNLKQVDMGTSVTSIGNNTFAGCYSLKTILLPESLTEIGDQAFQYCYGLSTLALPGALTAIGYGAFAECTALTEMAIPESVNMLPTGAFRNCEKLTTVTLPRSLASIGDDAFFGCKELVTVQYGGSVEDQKKIKIDAGNKPLTSAKWIYAIEEEEKTPVVHRVEEAEPVRPPWFTAAMCVAAILMAISVFCLLFHKSSRDR